jgi:hypothetical protein
MRRDFKICNALKRKAERIEAAQKRSAKRGRR